MPPSDSADHAARRPENHAARRPENKVLKLNTLRMLSNLIWDQRDVSHVLQQVSSGKGRVPIFGQFSLVEERPSEFRLVRDRLGLNKLFYHLDSATEVITVGHYLYDVAEATGDYNGIRSVPAGHQLEIDRKSRGTRLNPYWDLSKRRPDDRFDLRRFHQLADQTLSRFFAELRERFAATRFVVCLSGGVRSAVIAAYAKRFLQDVTAVSFCYEALNDRLRAAKSIADKLELPLLPVLSQRLLDEGTLKEVMRYGQDWREENVHRAWSNYLLAKHLHATFGGQQVVALTGSLLKEFIGGAPSTAAQQDAADDVSRERQRRRFIAGLDAGDRELGVFARWNVVAIQPFALLAERYLAVPTEFFSTGKLNDRLNIPLVHDAGLRELLLNRDRHVRREFDDRDTKQVFYEGRVKQRDLESRWLDLVRPLTRQGEPCPIIVDGKYRSDVVENRSQH